MNAETQYLELVKRVIQTGVVKEDRTGVGTRSLFGPQLKFDLRNDTLPVFTTRKTFWRGAVEELLWMISGETDAKKLSEKGVHIWDGNTSREFLNKRGLSHYDEGDIGPMYGFNMRYFGADYKGCNHDYTGQGVDQLKDALYLIKHDPDSRRINVINQNPAVADQCVLHACHQNFQFFVDSHKKELSCQLYIRSQDLLCGCGFNVIFYSLMTHLFAKVSELSAGDFIITMGDAHVYNNHITNALIQVEREPKPFPKISINKNINSLEDIEQLSYQDFELKGYTFHPRI
jgi:thymidylate synthase